MAIKYLITALPYGNCATYILLWLTWMAQTGTFLSTQKISSLSHRAALLHTFNNQYFYSLKDINHINRVRGMCRSNNAHHWSYSQNTTIYARLGNEISGGNEVRSQNKELTEQTQIIAFNKGDIIMLCQFILINRDHSFWCLPVNLSVLHWSVPLAVDADDGKKKTSLWI